MTRRKLVLIALSRSINKRCPHCGEGPLFSGWAHQLERCAVCGLIYEPHPGDTWAFTIIGDRVPVGVIVVLIYFGSGRWPPLLGSAAIVLMVGVMVWTTPNRWGAGIGLHYLSRVLWPDPADPLPAPPGDQLRARGG